MERRSSARQQHGRNRRLNCSWNKRENVIRIKHASVLAFVRACASVCADVLACVSVRANVRANVRACVSVCGLYGQECRE